jgi:hypothetical protein
MRNEYDHALVEMADLLELPGAPEPDLVIGRRVLTTLERSLLEKAVVGRGVDLGIPERVHMRALGPGSWPDAGADRSTRGRHQTERRPARPDPPAPPPPPSLSRRETLIAEARGMRRRLDIYESDERLWPTKVQEWCEDLDTYDRVLIDLAVVIGLPRAALPEGERRRLLSEERSSIEDGLDRVGLDLGASRPR